MRKERTSTNKHRVLVIVGPTASGKSALGVKLAKKMHGEIISADSRQVYKGLNIGTGKITKKEMRGVQHHLLNVASAKRQFTAEDFTRLGKKAIRDIAARGKLPIIVGGTGFYIDSLLGRIVLPNVPPNTSLRNRLSKKTPAALFSLLKKLDPARAKTIDSKNPRRTIRAIEIASALGKNPPPSTDSPFNTEWIGISPKTELLDKKIEKRLRERLKKGMIAEAKELKRSGLSYKRMEELGLEYRSLSRYLQGVISKSELFEELSRDIKRYAKKQMAYWKRNTEIKWRSVR